MRTLLSLAFVAAVACAADEPLKIAAPQNGGYTKVLYTPDGLRLIGIGYTGEATVWDVKTGKEVAKIATGGGQFGAASAAVVNDGGTLAIGVQVYDGRRKNGVHLYDLRTGKETAHWPTADPPSALAESPDGKLLAVGGGTKVRLFELASGEEKTPLTTPDKEIIGTGLGWTPDGKKLLVPVTTRKANGSELMVWEVESGAVLHRLPVGAAFGGRSFAVLPGGTELLAYARPDARTALSKLAVWDLDTGKEVRTIKTEARYAGELTLTPDGKRSVSADATGAGLVLTDLETGKAVQKWGKWYNTAAAVSPDGNSFASCGSSADPENPTAGILRVRIDGLKK